MSISKKIINKSNELYEEAMNDEALTVKTAGKAFLSGALEGLMDGCVFTTVVVFGMLFVVRFKK